MPSIAIPLPPNMVGMNTFQDYDFDSSSPYPPSSPSADSDVEDFHFYAPNAIRTSIASIPESKLRSIIVKLADSNPRFQRAIIKELAYASTDSPPTTPTGPKLHKLRRGKTRRNRNCKGLSVSTRGSYAHTRQVIPTQPLGEAECVYHPGHLDEEVYEFLSRTPKDVTFNVVRTINMWSCCDEDEWSPGCVVAPSYAIPIDPGRHREGIIEYSHPDIFPDSDLEQSYDDLLHGRIYRASREQQS